jgi:hypothetical protein
LFRKVPPICICSESLFTCYFSDIHSAVILTSTASRLKGSFLWPSQIEILYSILIFVVSLPNLIASTMLIRRI